MVENIGGINSSKASRSDTASTNSKRSVEDAGKGAMPESGSARESVNVELSEAVKRAEDKASYDKVRVRELKAAIESGNYPIDNAKIAENSLTLKAYFKII